MTPVRTVFLGSGSFGLEALHRLRDDPGIDLVGVVTAPPRPSGRRAAVTPTPIDAAAHDLGIAPVLTPPRLRAPEAIDSVRALEPALAVLADYGQLVPRPILDLPYGALNLHPSLLPRHRGATPIPAAILAGDRETGVTLFRMDEGLDSGPIVAARPAPVDPDDTATTLHGRLGIAAADLLAGSLPDWLRGSIEARPQPTDGVTMTRPLRREDGRLDPDRPAAALERQVRALDGWPGTFVGLDRGRLIVLAAHVAPAGAADEPGYLVAEGDGIALTTRDGRLTLDRVQPAAGRPMTGALYRRGRPDVAGARVVRPPG